MNSKSSEIIISRILLFLYFYSDIFAQVLDIQILDMVFTSVTIVVILASLGMSLFGVAPTISIMTICIAAAN